MKFNTVIVSSLNCVVLTLCLGVSAKAADLTVKIKGVANEKGTLRVSLYDNKDDWAKDMKSEKTENAVSFQKVTPKKGTTTMVFKDVEPGTFAVTLFHDENKNEKIDKGFLGIPTEDYGFSNDATPVLSAPDFSQCQFEFKQDKTIKINI